MPLPDLIEIEPLSRPVDAVVTVPGSKSITNRALILAALTAGETELHGALWSEDTQVMVECLRELGFMINVTPDLREPSNRTITVFGKGGEVPRGGSETAPLELFVGNAGTAARFLVAFVALGEGYYRLFGIPRMHERPQAGLFAALRELGYEVRASNEMLPVVIRGAGPKAGICQVSIRESSQFASALLLSARAGGWRVQVVGEDDEEMPYVRMTEQLIAKFGESAGSYQIEPDASSGSYFVAANALQQLGARNIGQKIEVRDWPASGWQIDSRFPQYALGPSNGQGSSDEVFTISRARELGDSVMTAIVLAPMWKVPAVFTDLGRLRVQECERVQALRTELKKCGAVVVEKGDTLRITPSALHGAEIETYNDHRMAMCFGTLALRIPGIKLRDPACVRKTFPNFFQKLAEPTPNGLGARIRDVRTNQLLSESDLVAE